MKLWVLPTLWKYVEYYWQKLTNNYNQKPIKQQHIQKKQQQKIIIKSNNTLLSDHHKFYKFNLNDLSDSLDSNKKYLQKKNKKINKSHHRQSHQSKNHKNLNKDNQLNANSVFINDSGQQISSIGAHQNSDSGQTVQQFLIHMQPKIVLSHVKLSNINKYKKQQARQKMLVNQIFGQTIKNRIIINNKDLPLPLRKNIKKSSSNHNSSKKNVNQGLKSK